MKKGKVWLDIYNSVTLFVFIATFFTSEHIDLSKKKQDDKNFIL